MWLPTLVLIPLLLVGPVAAQAQDQPPRIVEGEILNSFTGLPVRGADVKAFVITNIWPFIDRVVGKGASDLNGFYSMEVPSNTLLNVVVRCTTDRGLAIGQTDIPPNRGGVVRRTIYLDLGRRRAPIRCRESIIEGSPPRNRR